MQNEDQPVARIRYLKPEFFKDEDLAALPCEVRLFYAGLWGLADKAGRLEDRPLRLKAEIFPYDPVDPEKCLSLLAKSKRGSGKPFIHRYTTDSQRYIQILNWSKHQKPHHTERESEIPPGPPLITEKGTEKGTEKQDEASVKLSNCDVTVKQPIFLDGFDLFWRAYPKKVGKDAARTTWGKKKPPLDLCLKTIDACKKTEQWQKDDGQFIPNPATWLNQGRWEDEPPHKETAAEVAARYEAERRRITK